MKLKIARHSGFCFGVKQAVETALNAINDLATLKPIYSLGSLVHNSMVTDVLAEKGIIIVNDLCEINEPGTLIISAHGVPPRIYKDAAEKNLNIIDTTCIQVKKVQSLAKQLSDEGLQVIIIGDNNHPEVKGVKEWAGHHTIVISDPSDINSLIINDEIGIISQTTISQHLFDTISLEIQARTAIPARIFNTICSATSARQKAAIQLAHEADIMLIIGDGKSANTNRLYELSVAIQPDSYLVSAQLLLEKKWFAGKSLIGVTAGASTPPEAIFNVINQIKILGVY